MSIKPNTLISHYTIISAIGKGGMGEVYLANDTKLNRKVAIKFLSDEFSKDAEKLKRFLQEAQAASALNHPNILTIYEIGEFETSNFIATEFVEGLTLRQILQSDPPAVEQSIEIAIQTASALSAAHEAGIIHRDIKPENIIVRADGLVKVLDFGLAKFSLSGADSVDSEGQTRAQVNTEPGIIMGTVQYMSPEQTRGKQTDSRTDIWSLGCVFYEMLCQKPPFEGETPADLIAEIVKMNPIPIGQINPRIPDRLEEIVEKTLEKNPDERYQTIKDLVIDLKRLKKKLDLESDIENTHPPSLITGISEGQGSGQDARPTISLREGSTGNVETAQHTLSGAQLISSGIRRHKIGTAAIGLVLAVVFAGFGYGLYRFFSPAVSSDEKKIGPIDTQRLTGDGKTREAEISPDGKFLVYSKNEGDKQSLWIKQIQTNSNVEVLKGGEVDNIYGLVFSPDGNFVYFNGENDTTDVRTVFRIPTLGGTLTKFLKDAEQVQFSPDGRQISFARSDFESTDTAVFIANADGTNQRELASKTGTKFFNSPPAWSSDGKLIAVSAGDDELLPKPDEGVFLISVETGEITELGETKWVTLDDIVWHPTGDSLIVVASDTDYLPGQLWEVEIPTGKSRRLTNNLNGYDGISITSDGTAVVSMERYNRSAIWVSPDLNPENARQIMPSTGDTWGFVWTPDNRIVFISDQSGDAEVWIMNNDGTETRQLTNDRIFKHLPVVSPDGRYIVYSSAEGGGGLVRIDFKGGNLFEYKTGIGGDNPDISLESKWVIYSAWEDGKQHIFRIPIEGGVPQKLTDYVSTEPRYSPDGSQFACFVLAEKSQQLNRLAIVSAEGGKPLQTFNVPATTNIGRGPVWTPDGKGITIIDSRGEQQNLWLQPISGGPLKQMTNFDVPGAARRDYSRDGKQIAIVRGEAFTNAVMITGFR